MCAVAEKLENKGFTEGRLKERDANIATFTKLLSESVPGLSPKEAEERVRKALAEEKR